MIDSGKRTFGKQLRRNQKYDEAELLYGELWNGKGENWDKWLGWEYADVLKRIPKIDEAIKICKEVYRKYPSFKYNNDLLGWLLYEKYIKPITEDSTIQQINNMVKIAEFILSIVNQDGKKTAYESTIFKVINALRDRNHNENEIIKWMDKINYNLLSDNVINYNLHDGKSIEGASRKEEYFSLRTKLLEKIKSFSECIKWCRIAIETISKFHYSNDIWLNVRLNYCTVMVSENDETIQNAMGILIELVERKKHWSIYEKIFECYSKIGVTKKALKFGAKALLTNDPISMKVNLLYIFALELEKSVNVEEAAKHFALDAQIRENNNWKISYELRNRLAKYKIDDNYKVSPNDLYYFWVSLARTDEKLYKGNILKMMPHGRSGFILGEDGKNYYFKTESILLGLNHLTIGKEVSFKCIKSFDPRKQKESVEAAEIVIV